MIAAPSGNGTRSARPRLLCVDDEPHILESLRDTLRRGFDVHTATNGLEALDQLRQAPGTYAVIISDMRMPTMSGSVFLRESRRLSPDAARILLTGHADLTAAISAVNDGQLFRFLTKPCEPEELLRACAAGLGQHRLQSAERVLLEQTLKGSVQALADVLALANPAAFGRSERVRSMVQRLMQQAGCSDSWEAEVAALLVHVGAVTLPRPTAEKLYEGGRLDAGEQAMIDRIPAATSRILSNIPRLEGVLEILDLYRQPPADVGGAGALRVGASALKIALDYDLLEARGASHSVSLSIMCGREGVYDSDLLDAFASVVGADIRRQRVLEIALRHLAPGMMLAADVRSGAGSLLIARGHTVTDQLIERLANLTTGSIREPLLVIDVEPEEE